MGNFSISGLVIIMTMSVAEANKSHTTGTEYNNVLLPQQHNDTWLISSQMVYKSIDKAIKFSNSFHNLHEGFTQGRVLSVPLM